MLLLRRLHALLLRQNRRLGFKQTDGSIISSVHGAQPAALRRTDVA